MKRPTPEQIALAIDWLECYESSDPVSREDEDSVKAVAAWLRASERASERRAEARAIRSFAAEHHTTPERVRAALAAYRARRTT